MAKMPGTGVKQAKTTSRKTTPEIVGTVKASPGKVSTKSTAKKPPTKKTASVILGAEERYKMIEVAAYYIAERNQFSGDPKDFWAEAEKQVNRMLGNTK